MAGGKSSSFSASVLKLLFQGVAIANVADNAGSSPLTNLYVSLHTADPGAAGSQTTNEVAYTGYSRVAVARTTGGWAIASTTITPVSAITFPNCSGGSTTANAWGIGYSAYPTANALFYRGPISPAISISAGVTPQLTVLSTVTEA